MSDLKEYIVTLHNKEDLDAFYEDMETPGGNLYIPDRAVDLADRRPISRNTHYYLTDAEAEQIRNDPRVLYVDIPVEHKPYIKPVPHYSQYSDYWNKNFNSNSNFKNWGLYRCTRGSQVANWGWDNVSNASGSIQVNAEGRNVDVVIVDGCILTGHPEFAVNVDGTGGSRVTLFNWLSLTPLVTGGAAGTYVYDTAWYGGTHGTHVAGTVCGNTQGWARKANIYNIYPYGVDSNPIDGTRLFDYIRAFHNNKSINPVTKRRNPTILNNSWSYIYSISISNISFVSYRGVGHTGPFTSTQLRNYGVPAISSTFGGSVRVPSIDADIADAIADGIIIVGSAGNYDETIVTSSSADYDNYLIVSGNSLYYQRGSTPGSASTVLCIGALNAEVIETKAYFSSAGSRVDLYAPGTNIISAVLDADGYEASDPRNPAYIIEKYSGTSMSSPQVAGVLACELEIYPRMNQSMAREYILNYAKNNQITDNGPLDTNYTSLYGLRGAANKYLFYYNERKNSGAVFPKTNYWIRKSTGSVYPRTLKRKNLPR